MTMRILIVDDSKAMRMIVRRTLRQAGYGECEVAEACDGREALQQIVKFRPNLVLCDWNMPGMTGLDVLKAIKKASLALTFGFVTTEASPQMRALAEENGATFLLAKPFTPETFKAALMGATR